jgi:solute carrier family 8 (sodium/calcium exchanger)
VTESNGTVEITIIKKVVNQQLTFGFRTVEDTAKPIKDYTHCEEVITMEKRETEKKIHIPIVDDDEWEPDLDFFVELYDHNKINPETGLFEKLAGDDTRCKVTILDEDFPGCLGFEMTDVRVSSKADKVDVKVVRMEGADGMISCYLRTEILSEQANPTNAIEFEDYVPKHEEIKFLHGENEKTITIELVQNKINLIEPKIAGDEKTMDDE